MAVGEFYVALVEPTDTTFLPEFARQDIACLQFALTQREGEFCVFTLSLRNQQIGLLNPAHKRHIWLSWHTPSGVAPLFFGSVVGVPADINKMRETLTVRARPENYDTAKRALAATLKVSPFWDEVWVDEDNRNDPDFVLQTRTQRYHYDRLTHAITVSDMLTGEDGTLEFGDEDNPIIDCTISYDQAPKSTVFVRGELGWTQRGTGTVDVTGKLLQGFANAGSSVPGMVSSYTWEALSDSWPLPGDDIGGGWSWEDSNIEDGNARWVAAETRLVNNLTVWSSQLIGQINTALELPNSEPIQEQVRGEWVMGVMKPTMIARWDAEISRTEIIEITMSSSIQPVLGTPESEAPISITLSSNDVGEPVDVGGATPIPDLRLPSYLNTDRGLQSFEYLIMRGRAELIDSARCVTIGVLLPFRNILDVTLRKGAVVYDDRLPGGQAAGKIVSYEARGDGTSGEFRLLVVVACAVGYGESVAAVAGVNSYISDDYIVESYYTRIGAVRLLAPGDITYADYRNGFVIPGNDVNLMNVTADDVVNSVIVTNGPTHQANQINSVTYYQSISEATTSMEGMTTQVCMDFKPVTGGPYESLIEVTTGLLSIPQGIDLEAA